MFGNEEYSSTYPKYDLFILFIEGSTNPPMLTHAIWSPHTFPIAGILICKDLLRSLSPVVQLADVVLAVTIWYLFGHQLTNQNYRRGV